MLDFGSTVGKWTVVVPGPTQPGMSLHLLWREQPHQYHKDEAGKVTRYETFEVSKFKLVQLPEGDWSPKGPALESTHAPFMEGNEVIEFMQAIVNEAAKLGIYAAGTKDLTKEMTATKAHLDDMRKLVFKSAGL